MATYCFTCTLLFVSSAACLQAAAPLAVQLSHAALAVGLLAMSGGFVEGAGAGGALQPRLPRLELVVVLPVRRAAFIEIAVVMPATATPVAIHAPIRIFPYLSL